MKKKRRINGQKLFCFISLIFILTCIMWYGGRLVYFYIESHKTTKATEVSLAKTLMTGNKNLKKTDEGYYYYQNADNNYVTYSNITFRILKITNDNKIVLVTDEPITNLAFGTESEFENTPIIKWLNNDTKGIFGKSLNSTDKYLDQTETCIDEITDIKNLTCNKKKTTLISLLTIADYINTGSTKSFINNENTTYLSNTNNKEKWLINSEGKLTTDDGNSIYGIKAVITLKPSITLSKGNGTKDNPYIFETEKTYFGSYVKLDNDIWRVYEEEDKLIKLSLNDYIKVNSKKIEHIYSSTNSYHNDTIFGSLAYYLNNTYYNTLSYKDSIITNNYSNGYYTEDNDYDYNTSLESKVDTKVSNLSVGNIILNQSLDNYFLATGLYNKSDYIYLAKKAGNIETIKVTKEANIVPCISIDKTKLVSGTGTKDDPYRME